MGWQCSVGMYVQGVLSSSPNATPCPYPDVVGRSRIVDLPGSRLRTVRIPVSSSASFPFELGNNRARQLYRPYCLRTYLLSSVYSSCWEDIGGSQDLYHCFVVAPPLLAVVDIGCRYPELGLGDTLFRLPVARSLGNTEVVCPAFSGKRLSPYHTPSHASILIRTGSLR